jgi:hypothetical protein
VRVRAPARCDDGLEIGTSGASVSRSRAVRVQIVRSTDRTTIATGSTVHATLDRSGRPCRLPERVKSVLSKALVTGAAGFIGSTLTERLLAHGADVVGLDCFTDYYPRAIKERNLCGAKGQPGFRFVESRIQDADLPSLLSDRTHVFHLAAQAGVRKSWGREFDIYTVNNVEATQRLLEACTSVRLEDRLRVELVGVATTPLPMREDLMLQPVRHAAADEARRRTALLSVPRQLRTADRVAAPLHRLRTSTAARHGFPNSCARPFAASRSRCSATANRHAISRMCTMP